MMQIINQIVVEVNNEFKRVKLRQDEESPVYMDIKEELDRKMNFRSKKIYVYGSCIMGISSDDSDVDFFVDMGKCG